MAWEKFLRSTISSIKGTAFRFIKKAAKRFLKLSTVKKRNISKKNSKVRTDTPIQNPLLSFLSISLAVKR